MITGQVKSITVTILANGEQVYLERRNAAFGTVGINHHYFSDSKSLLWRKAIPEFYMELLCIGVSRYEVRHALGLVHGCVREDVHVQVERFS